MCEEVPVTIQFNEDKKWLWELARPTFKGHKSNIKAMKRITKGLFEERNKMWLNIIIFIASRLKS